MLARRCCFQICGRLSPAALLVCAGPALAQLENPVEATIPADGVRVTLMPLATGLTAPNWATGAPGISGRMFVTDQPGTVWAVNTGTGARTVFLDVSARLVPLGIAGPGSFDERGLIGLAFHPGYATNGLLYTFESHPATGTPDFTTMPAGTPPNCQSVITEWRVPNPADPASVVDPSSARELLRFDKPQFNHNAGQLEFGPDGMLYIATGDGGMADDQGVGHVEGGNGQAITNILGKILRIDPRGSNSTNGDYGIPADNPFVGADGVDEIWAYGFRNPFRFTFDSITGALWAGDVGQNDIEEVDIVTRGGNFGWRIKEGTFLFDPNGAAPGFVTADSPGQPAGLIDPVAQYDHDEGISVIGGEVYRGSSTGALRGRYVFGDFATSFGPGAPGRLFHLDGSNNIHEFRYLGDAFSLKLLGIGRDDAGELYALANMTGTPFGTTGVILRIDPACPADFNGDDVLNGRDVAAFTHDLRESIRTGATLDFNDDGATNQADMTAFIRAWVDARHEGGCPD